MTASNSAPENRFETQAHTQEELPSYTIVKIAIFQDFKTENHIPEKHDFLSIFVFIFLEVIVFPFPPAATTADSGGGEDGSDGP